MSKRNSNISIHHHPLAFIVEPERIRATRRGEIVHYALGSLGQAWQGGAAGADAPGHLEREIELAVGRAFAVLDLDPSGWQIQEDFVKPLIRVFALPEFKAWFDPAATSLEETEIMDSGGDVCRPDRIVFREGKIEVIDFKAGKREDSHREQVGKYVGLLRAIFEGSPVVGYLVYIDEPAVVELR